MSEIALCDIIVELDEARVPAPRDPAGRLPSVVPPRLFIPLSLAFKESICA
jgi:hypothetical protein